MDQISLEPVVLHIIYWGKVGVDEDVITDDQCCRIVGAAVATFARYSSAVIMLL